MPFASATGGIPSNPHGTFPSQEERMSAIGEVPDTNLGTRLPAELARLLSAEDDAAREAAWAGLLESYSRLLLYLARSLGGDHDAAMDRYAFILERLSQDDFRKLRTYRCDGRAKFSTWLSVVARRLCLDCHRERYGRVRPAPAGHRSTSADSMACRRALATLTNGAIEVTALADPNAADPEAEVRLAELRSALAGALRDLEPSDRLLLTQWFKEGRSGAEIASALGYCDATHVYRRLRTVCGRLRDRLEQRGIQEARP